jgi:DNA modification methylase
MNENEPRNLSDLPVKLEELNIKDINTAGRSRNEYGDIESLKLSIQQKGLIQPISVMEYSEPYNSFKYFLLTGGRRLRAITQLGWKTISARIYPDGLNGFEIRTIELEENIKRLDITDAERIKSLKQIHDLWIEIYGEKSSTAPGASGHSMRDTAQKLGISVGSVSMDLEIGRWLEEIPELAKLGNRKDIKRAIDRAKGKVKRERMLENLSDDKLKESTSDVEGAYIVGDFFKEVKSIQDSCIDLVEIDIDYPLEIDDNIMHVTAKDNKSDGDYKSIDKEEYPKLIKDSLKEAYRILSDNSWCLVWFGMEYYDRLLKWSEEIGFKTSWYFGKWYKTDSFGHIRNPEYNLKHTMEYFLYLKKGSPRIINYHTDVFTYKPDGKSSKNHPYQKPIALMSDILQTFVEPQSRIVVPFAGSGNTLVASKLHDCTFWGCDTSEEYKKSFVLTIREMKMRGLL